MYNKCNHLADSGPCVGRNHLGEAITPEKKLSGLLTYPAITRTRPDELLNQKKGDTFKMLTGRFPSFLNAPTNSTNTVFSLAMSHQESLSVNQSVTRDGPQDQAL